MVEAFERTLKFSFRNEAQPEWLTFGSLDHNDKKYGIRKGQIKLEGFVSLSSCSGPICSSNMLLPGLISPPFSIPRFSA